MLRLTALACVLVVSAFAQNLDMRQIGRCVPERFRVIDEYLNPDRQWLSWDSFNHTYMVGKEYQHLPVITAEVTAVPCASRGCCTVLMSMRPNTTDMAVFQQVFQWNFFSPIYKHLQNMQPKYILDGGGNVGYTASLFALLYPNAQIISVEPDKSNFATHKMNTHRFPNVHAVNAGLWDKQTFITVMASEGEWGMMFKETGTSEAGAVFGTTIPALMKRFRFPRLDFAKIDIEGAESRVLGADADLSWLDNTQLLCMELHDWMAGYYGLQTVSDIVYNTMGSRPFTHKWDGEHIFYMHDDLMAASVKEQGPSTPEEDGHALAAESRRAARTDASRRGMQDVSE